jgi:hypothetical protein
MEEDEKTFPVYVNFLGNEACKDPSARANSPCKEVIALQDAINAFIDELNGEFAFLDGQIEVLSENGGATSAELNSLRTQLEFCQNMVTGAADQIKTTIMGNLKKRRLNETEEEEEGTAELGQTQRNVPLVQLTDPFAIALAKLYTTRGQKLPTQFEDYLLERALGYNEDQLSALSVEDRSLAMDALRQVYHNQLLSIAEQQALGMNDQSQVDVVKNAYLRTISAQNRPKKFKSGRR